MKEQGNTVTLKNTIFNGYLKMVIEKNYFLSFLVSFDDLHLTQRN